MLKKDCFGYVPGKRECQILTENVCEIRKCTFYKTKENYKRGLAGLPPIDENGGRKSGRRSKAVRCIETGHVYQGYRKAEQEMCLPHQSVWRVCRGMQKEVYGYHFEYYEPEM